MKRRGKEVPNTEEKRNFRREKKSVKERSIFCNVAPFQNMKGNAKKERSIPSKYKDFKQIEIIHFKETSRHIYCKNAPNFNLPQHRESSLRHPCESRTIKMRKLYNGPFIDLVIFFCEKITS